MASAYRSATRATDQSEFDDEESVISSPESSQTLGADSFDDSLNDYNQGIPAPARQTSTLDQLPVELRNKILMLTSRGVSHR
jgi:hypothetical protein